MSPANDPSITARPWRRRLLSLIPLLVSALFLWLVLRRVEWATLGQSLAQVNYAMLPLVVAVYLLGFVPRAAKWRIILAKLGPVSLHSALGYSFVGCAGNAVLPARLGEVVRAYIAGRRENLSGAAVLSTIVLERVLEVLSLMLLFSFAILATGQGGLKAWALGGMAACLGVFAVLVVMQRRGDWLMRLIGLVPWPGLRDKLSGLGGRFLEGLAVVRDPGRLAVVVSLGLLVYLVEGAAYWLLARALGLSVGYLPMLLVLCFIFVGMLIPAAAGNIGPLQYFGMLGLSFFGVGPAPGLVFTVLLNAILYVPALVGLIYLARYGIGLSGLGRAASQGLEETT